MAYRARAGEEKDMKVLVTGGAGFIGSHVVERLLALKFEVVVLDDLSSGKVENIPPDVRFIKQDITLDMKEVFEGQDFDAVVHLAAQVSVPHSIQDPLLDQKVNIEGLLRLLEACRHYHVESFIFASSAAVYGTPHELPVTEDHPTVPLSPYGLTKRMSEEYLRLYSELHGVRSTVLRFSNVYGPRQPVKGESGVISIFADRLRRGEAPTIFGDGTDTRDYVYVKDVARAVQAALEARRTGTFNIGTQTSVTLNELYAQLLSVSGLNLPAQYGPPRPGDIRHSLLSIERIQRELHWYPQVTLEQGLTETMAWAMRS
jgi:UDP-glucose 4-epimerase